MQNVDMQNVDMQNVDIQNVGIQNVDIQNNTEKYDDATPTNLLSSFVLLLNNFQSNV